MTVNNVVLTGYLGADCEIKELSGDKKIALLRLAVDDSYKNRETGEVTEKTYWVRCVSFHKGLVESLGKYAKKGRLVAVEGKLTMRSYLDKKENKQTITEIIINRVSYLGKKEQGLENTQQEQNSSTNNGLDDEIPF